jgi:hypothetical protein
MTSHPILSIEQARASCLKEIKRIRALLCFDEDIFSRTRQ